MIALLIMLTQHYVYIYMLMTHICGWVYPRNYDSLHIAIYIHIHMMGLAAIIWVICDLGRMGG